MKHLLAIALMLVVMGQRWELYSTSAGECRFDDTLGILCEPYYYRYQLHWVIGESLPVPCTTVRSCAPDLEERFTIPDPKTPVRTMTREEAEKVNRGLMR